MWTLRAVLAWTKEHFAAKEVEAASLSAELLLAHALGKTRLQLYLDMDKPLSTDERERFKELVKRRTAGEPVAYILGHKEFYGVKLRVTRDVLIPRADTETILDLVLQMSPRPVRIVDLGTGSGALALALAHEIPEAEVLAVESSPKALAVAEGNARDLGLSGRVRFLLADWAEVPHSERAEVVVCNPPYIAHGEVVDPWVDRYEPHAALYSAGRDGLDATRTALEAARRILNAGGRFFFEVGAGRAAAVKALAEGLGFSNLSVHKDLQHVERVVCGDWVPSPLGMTSRAEKGSAAHV